MYHKSILVCTSPSLFLINNVMYDKILKIEVSEIMAISSGFSAFDAVQNVLTYQ